MDGRRWLPPVNNTFDFELKSGSQIEFPLLHRLRQLEGFAFCPAACVDMYLGIGHLAGHIQKAEYNLQPLFIGSKLMLLTKY